MRELYIIMVLLLVFTSCNRQQVKQPDVMPNNTPLVIDYPAGVIIGSQKQRQATRSQNLSTAEKILSPHRVPVLDTNMQQLVFVKLNGDRVTISMDELAGKYDIILFNAVTNPVPLRIADLQGAFDKIFYVQALTHVSHSGYKYLLSNNKQETDSTIQNSNHRNTTGIRNRDKKIIVATADTTSEKFIARAIPGIEWVEQRVDTRTILKVNFENDLISYANTDRYFTNGICFDLQAPWIGRSAFQKLMIPYRHKAFVTYNLSMVTDMYTPTDTRVEPTLNNDRPYASYLYFGFRKSTADQLRQFKITTELDLGYIGPYSPGSYMQTLVHKAFPTNDIPLGWETQINTDVIINYSLLAQKALVANKNFTLLASLDVKAGTLQTSSGAGLQLQAGKAEPVFGLTENEAWPNTEYYFFAKTYINFVAYNALLQGGMFNHENIFTLTGNQIQRMVGSAEAGIHIRYKAVGIELAQHYLTPEYKGGLWHQWGRMSLLFRL
jgi:lipid A 3-O-deacylase